MVWAYHTAAAGTGKYIDACEIVIFFVVCYLALDACDVHRLPLTVSISNVSLFPILTGLLFSYSVSMACNSL